MPALSILEPTAAPVQGEEQPCAKEGHAAEALRDPTGRHRARESPPGDGWGSQVEQERVWVDMSMGRGWAEPQAA